MSSACPGEFKHGDSSCKVRLFRNTWKENQQKLNALDWHPPLHSQLSKIPAILEEEHLSKLCFYYTLLFFYFFNPLCCHCPYWLHHFIIDPFSFLFLAEYLSSKKTEYCSIWRGPICHSFSCPEEKDNYSPSFILGIMAKQDWYLFWNYYSPIHKSCPESLAHVASPQAHHCRKYILNSLLSFNFGSSSRSFRFIATALFPVLIFGTEKC